MLDRRVEITGPTDRKMVINALPTAARRFAADFEDACRREQRDRRAICGMQSVTIFRTRRQAVPAMTDGRADPAHAAGTSAGVLIDGKHVSGGITDFALLFF
jgi:malate synthase